MRTETTRRTRRIGAAATCAAAAAAIGLPILGAGDAAAAPTSNCSFTFANPNLTVLRGYANVFINDVGGDRARVTVISNPQTLFGYHQQANLTWANLDTGRTGSAALAPVRVVGQDAEFTFPTLRTGPGRIAFVVGLSNDRGITGITSTNGDCSVEHRVG